MAKKWIFFVLLAFSVPSFAHEQDGQLWGQVMAMGRLKEESPWRFFLEYQTRHSFEQDRNYETLLRPAVYYQLNHYTTLWLGYLSVRRHDFSEGEQRPWQQILYNRTWQNHSMMFRFRQEQRFRQNSLANGNDETQALHRSRLMIRWNSPEWVLGSLRWRWLAVDEIFWNLNSVASADFTPIRSGLGQNRVYLGATHHWSEKLTVDAGYLHTYTERHNLMDLHINGFFTTIWYRW